MLKASGDAMSFFFHALRLAFFLVPGCTAVQPGITAGNIVHGVDVVAHVLIVGDWRVDGSAGWRKESMLLALPTPTSEY